VIKIKVSGGVAMIFYFSGTGNSLQVAKDIANCQNDRLISIAALISRKKDVYEFSLDEKEAVGFVFPVYAWAPPAIVLQFIERLNLVTYKDNFIYSVVT